MTSETVGNSSTKKARIDPADSVYSDFLSPRYWPTWIAIGVLWVLALLPMPILSLIGYLIGGLTYLVHVSRRKIALKNIRSCFTELSLKECKRINFTHYLLLGQAVMTTPINWWIGRQRFERLVEVVGHEYYQAALDEGRNIILLAPHCMAMEVSGLVLQQYRPMIGMYQYMKNPLLNKIAYERRQRFCTGGHMFDRKDPLRSILRALNKGMPMQYSPDQDAGRKGVFVPFFEPLASTTPALGKFAQVTNALVIPICSTFKPFGFGYKVTISEPIKDFPCGDELRDTTVMNRAIEKMIRQHPSQYLWVHKRFKSRPEGEPAFY